MVARLFSAAFIGIEALLIEIEIDLKRDDKQAIRIIGLPDMAVKEAKDRVLVALKNNGVSSESWSATIHLAPANLKKGGAFYDLPIALGLLSALEALSSSKSLGNYLICGELGLSGEVRLVRGALSLALLAKKLGKRGVVIPASNAQEVALIPDIEIVAVSHLSEAVAFFKEGALPPFVPQKVSFQPMEPPVNMGDIKGQLHAKRALEIAAAGRHNLLMSGPPGAGKTMLARAFAGILPELSLEEALEVTSIHSLSGLSNEMALQRPFRSPHHTISFAGMLGGGSYPKPGEVSLAHRGVLFLDELPEFSRTTLEVLRQPLEDREVTVSRASGKVTFPTDFICIAAMNPCPCGFLGHPEKACRDSQLQIERYRSKISGPFLDRIDLRLDVAPVKYEEMAERGAAESSAAIRKRVKEARQFLREHPNPSIDPTCEPLLKEAMEVMGISARGHTRLLRVARTIAALDQCLTISEDHLAEALSYRT